MLSKKKSPVNLLSEFITVSAFVAPETMVLFAVPPTVPVWFPELTPVCSPARIVVVESLSTLPNPMPALVSVVITHSPLVTWSAPADTAQ